MSEQSVAVARPTYVSSQADADAAAKAYPHKVVVWRASFGHAPLGDQYSKEYEDPPFNPSEPFAFPDHPFWG